VDRVDEHAFLVDYCCCFCDFILPVGRREGRKLVVVVVVVLLKKTTGGRTDVFIAVP